MATPAKIEKFYDKLLKEDKLTKEQVDKNLKTAAYIRKMAGYTSTDIKRWDLHKIFSEDNINLISDARKINELFFSRKAELKKKKKEEFQNIADIPGLADSIDKYVNANKDIKINSLKKEIDKFHKEAADAFSQANTSLSIATEKRLQLEKLDNGLSVSQKLKEELNEVLSESNWVNPVFKDGYLYLNTAANLELVYENKAAKLNIRAAMGQFFVKINMQNWQMQVFPYKANVSARSYFHPHVSMDGWICWGRSQSQVEKHISNLELASVLRLLYALLTIYCDERPYVPIEEFTSQTKWSYSKQNSRIHPDRIEERNRRAEAKLAKLREQTSNSTGKAEIDPSQFADTVTIVRESDGAIF